MKSVIVIPARLGSTRLPEKLLLSETGKPLICHTLDCAVAACNASGGAIQRVYVAADDPAILEVVQAYCREGDLPAEGVMTRSDHPSGSDRIAEVAESLEVDAVINLQGDEPEVAVQNILGVLNPLQEEDGPDISTLIYAIEDETAFANPNLVKCVRGAGGRALYFSRAAIPFDRDGTAEAPLGYGHLGMYAYRKEALMRFVSLPAGTLEQRERLEQLRALENGMSIEAVLLEGSVPEGIDTREDYDAFVKRWRLQNPPR